MWAGVVVETDVVWRCVSAVGDTGVVHCLAHWYGGARKRSTIISAVSTCSDMPLRGLPGGGRAGEFKVPRKEKINIIN